MTFYLVDDDTNILKILTTIINSQHLGKVIGAQVCPDKALEDILYLEPDICLVDCLMPGMDGNSLVRRIKSEGLKTRIIMISQVSDQEIIAESYTSGVDFYISKPINHIEVVSVIRQVIEKIDILQTLETIKSTLNPQLGPKKDEALTKQQHILSQLGILGELGSKDILCICSAWREKAMPFGEIDINQLIQTCDADVKIVKQRIRRALSVALRNLANLGLEDFYNDHFQHYTTYLFDFESMKVEMDRIRGKSIKGPRIDVDKFLLGLQLIVELEEAEQ